MIVGRADGSEERVDALELAVFRIVRGRNPREDWVFDNLPVKAGEFNRIG